MNDSLGHLMKQREVTAMYGMVLAFKIYEDAESVHIEWEPEAPMQIAG